jgi:dTDP-4-amino-4,6-dideoxygalactose transaminase
MLSISRDEVIEELREAGVGTSVHFIPAFKHPYYRDNFGLKENDYPEAGRLYECILTLPFFPGIKKWETTEVAQRLKKIISKHRSK